MKTEFEARPVYVRRDDRIKAHFMTCYISLLLYRLLEKKIGNSYTTEQLIKTLRSMKMTLLNTANGYVPSYTRTEITDSLHKTFIAAKQKTAVSLDFTGFTTVFSLSNCQRWDHMRWGIETAYETLKSRLQLENFTGTKPILLLQDIYSTIYLSEA